jgi:hypothetical protein
MLAVAGSVIEAPLAQCAPRLSGESNTAPGAPTPFRVRVDRAADEQ